MGLLFIRPQDWVPFLHSFHLLDIVAVGAVFVIVNYFMNEEKTFPSILENPQFVLVLLFWFVIIFSYISQFFLAEIIRSFKVIGKPVLFFTLVMVTINSRKRLDQILIFLLGCLVVLGFHCTLQKLTGHGFGGLGPVVRGGSFNPIIQVQAFGIFANPNDIGTITALGVVVSFSLIQRFWPHLFRCLGFFLLSLFFCLVLFWTQSRQAVLALGVGVFTLFFSKRHGWLALLLSIFIIFFVVSHHRRWRENSLGQDDSVGRRISCVTRGLQIFREKPVFGVGMDRAYDAVGMKMPLHNSYLQILVENGFPGLFVLVGIYLCSILQLHFFCRALPELPGDEADIYHARLIFALILVTAIGSYFRNRSYLVDVFFFLSLAAAFGLNMLRTYPAALPNYFQKNWLWGKGALICALATAGMIFILHLSSRLYWLCF